MPFSASAMPFRVAMPWWSFRAKVLNQSEASLQLLLHKRNTCDLLGSSWCPSLLNWWGAHTVLRIVWQTQIEIGLHAGAFWDVSFKCYVFCESLIAWLITRVWTLDMWSWHTWQVTSESRMAVWSLPRSEKDAFFHQFELNQDAALLHSPFIIVVAMMSLSIMFITSVSRTINGRDPGSDSDRWWFSNLLSVYDTDTGQWHSTHVHPMLALELPRMFCISSGLAPLQPITVRRFRRQVKMTMAQGGNIDQTCAPRFLQCSDTGACSMSPCRSQWCLALLARN